MSGRSPAEIRASIESNRAELALSVQRLRGEVEVLTDWRGQIEAHRKEVMIGAAIAVRAAVSLPPAEGMRPPAPARFEAGLVERLGALDDFAASTSEPPRVTAGGFGAHSMVMRALKP